MAEGVSPLVLAAANGNRGQRQQKIKNPKIEFLDRRPVTVRLPNGELMMEAGERPLEAFVLSVGQTLAFVIEAKLANGDPVPDGTQIETEVVGDSTPATISIGLPRPTLGGRTFVNVKGLRPWNTEHIPKIRASLEGASDEVQTFVEGVRFTGRPNGFDIFLNGEVQPMRTTVVSDLTGEPVEGVTVTATVTEGENIISLPTPSAVTSPSGTAYIGARGLLLGVATVEFDILSPAYDVDGFEGRVWVRE